MPTSLFSFTISSNDVSLAPGGSAQVTLTQTAQSGVTVNYRISSVSPGGYNDSTTIDPKEQISQSLPFPRTITGNGTLTLTLSAAADATAHSIETYIYGYAVTSNTGNQPVSVTLLITISVI